MADPRTIGKWVGLSPEWRPAGRRRVRCVAKDRACRAAVPRDHHPPL